MSKKPLRVLILSPFFSPNIGGVESHLDDLCAYLQNRGHGVSVITYQPLTTNAKSAKYESKQNVDIQRIGWVGYNLFHRLEPYPMLEFLYLSPLLLMYSFSFMLRYRNVIDVIHAHGINAAFVAKILKKLFKKRVVVSIHAIYNLSKKPMLAKLMKISLSSSNVVLALANKSKVELVKMGLDKNRVRVFTNWVDQTVFKPVDKLKCKSDLGLCGKFVVLFVGRLIELKGVKVLLDVAIRFADVKDIAFVFVGDGPLSAEIRAATTNHGNIFYVGKVEVEKLSQYYSAADIFVAPSIYEEGFGRVILEALSCGTPVIASNKGGIPEVLASQVGILVDPSVEEIQQTIMALYINTNKLAGLRRNCRTYAENRFSLNNAKLIENAYSG